MASMHEAPHDWSVVDDKGKVCNLDAFLEIDLHCAVFFLPLSTLVLNNLKEEYPSIRRESCDAIVFTPEKHRTNADLADVLNMPFSIVSDPVGKYAQLFHCPGDMNPLQMCFVFGKFSEGRQGFLEAIIDLHDGKFQRVTHKLQELNKILVQKKKGNNDIRGRWFLSPPVSGHSSRSESDSFMLEAAFESLLERQWSSLRLSCTLRSSLTGSTCSQCIIFVRRPIAPFGTLSLAEGRG
eukprot:CAMPEP_0196655876 /NCGR_PEP_ID=MMETSP1086-20130531/10004_1 /TAXON_ID=77921 /ORGANISM="Cyanoptyche  gloeocystis , Strain SAG4.97" /LENGTH=237 /DNA_ID=CAMNT_0041988401 /DNA_START=61 /DNA_END=772 /DNA_ORIENTATION=+